MTSTKRQNNSEASPNNRGHRQTYFSKRSGGMWDRSSHTEGGSSGNFPSQVLATLKNSVLEKDSTKGACGPNLETSAMPLFLDRSRSVEESHPTTSRQRKKDCRKSLEALPTNKISSTVLSKDSTALPSVERSCSSGRESTQSGSTTSRKTRQQLRRALKLLIAHGIISPSTTLEGLPSGSEPPPQTPSEVRLEASTLVAESNNEKQFLPTCPSMNSLTGCGTSKMPVCEMAMRLLSRLELVEKTMGDLVSAQSPYASYESISDEVLEALDDVMLESPREDQELPSAPMQHQIDEQPPPAYDEEGSNPEWAEYMFERGSQEEVLETIVETVEVEEVNPEWQDYMRARDVVDCDYEEFEAFVDPKKKKRFSGIRKMAKKCWEAQTTEKYVTLGMWHNRCEKDVEFRHSVEKGEICIKSTVYPGLRWEVVKSETGDTTCVQKPIPTQHPILGGPSDSKAYGYASDEDRAPKELVLSRFMNVKGLRFVDLEMYVALKRKGMALGTSKETHAKLMNEAHTFLARYLTNHLDPVFVNEVICWTVAAAMLPTESELRMVNMMTNKHLYEDMNRVAQFKRSGVVEFDDGCGCLGARRTSLHMYELKW